MPCAPIEMLARCSFRPLSSQRAVFSKHDTGMPEHIPFLRPYGKNMTCLWFITAFAGALSVWKLNRVERVLFILGCKKNYRHINIWWNNVLFHNILSPELHLIETCFAFDSSWILLGSFCTGLCGSSCLKLLTVLSDLFLVFHDLWILLTGL